MHRLDLVRHRSVLALAVILPLLPGTRAVTADRETRPPQFPDVAHVFNGCHLSTIAYLAQFKAYFGNETGEPLVVRLLNDGGIRRSHTVALITWQGEWWCRDEYFGVCPLGLEVGASVSRERLTARAARMLQRTSRIRMNQPGFILPPTVPANLSIEQLRREAAVAAQMIPFPVTVYWIRSGIRDTPLVFFRPGNGRIAVYHPNHGTCVAESSCTNDAAVVEAVATRLGYKVDALRADALEHFPPDSGIAFARQIAEIAAELP